MTLIRMFVWLCGCVPSGMLRNLVTGSKKEVCGVDLGLGFHRMDITEGQDSEGVEGVGGNAIHFIGH